MLNIELKTFSQLSTDELYQLLRLRSEVFVVEQDCVYQDLDNKDQKALHILGFNNSEIVAYTRVFKPGFYFEEASIGRVVVNKNYRQHGYGYDIMNASVNAIKQSYKTEKIRISAQLYLKKFYNNLNFIETGDEYLEDGIPHINMLYSP